MEAYCLWDCTGHTNFYNRSLMGELFLIGSILIIGLYNVGLSCERACPASPLPGRTGRSSARNPHRPGRAQLRHPVLRNKDSLGMSPTHFQLSGSVSLTRSRQLPALSWAHACPPCFPPSVLCSGDPFPPPGRRGSASPLSSVL